MKPPRKLNKRSSTSNILVFSDKYDVINCISSIVSVVSPMSVIICHGLSLVKLTDNRTPRGINITVFSRFCSLDVFSNRESESLNE